MPQNSLEKLTQAVKSEAHRLGFTLVGITTPDPPPHFDLYEAWLAQGRHGEMGYLASDRSRQRREDPRRILAACKSILVLGIPYTPASDHDFQSAGFGRVASYAWGDDYHDVLLPRMLALVEFIETTTGESVPNRYYTDTGPVMERDLGQRAGLGWIGKNTCLIQPQSGSYFLLAEVLLGIALVPDRAFTADHCGTCTRCLEACPTDCILPDRTIDARRCISYLTIELKGAIPLELRPQMGNWVFGCDICQQVCPWNLRFAKQQGDPGIASRPELARPDLVESIHLTPEAFNARFKGTPIKRAKRRGYLRNTAVALGNLDDPEAIRRAVPALAAALREDPEPLVRSHAAWALGQLGGKTARVSLESALQTEENNEVREEIKQALEAIR